MKKLVFAAILVTVFAAVSIFPVFAAEPVWRILHDGATFYRDESLTEAIRTLPANAEVSILNDYASETAAKAVYMGETGYILKSNLYLTSEPVYDGETELKVTASVLGETVPMRKFPYDDSPVLKELKDGETVIAKTGGVIYTGYTEVTYGGEVGYIKNESLTTGLTLNGAIALTVGVITAVLAVLILVLLGYSKRVKNEKMRREQKLIEEAREYGEQP